MAEARKESPLCPSCQQKSEHERFCSNCGADIQEFDPEHFSESETNPSETVSEDAKANTTHDSSDGFFDEEKMEWYDWIWIGLPLIMILLGGAIGGAIGGATFVLNKTVLTSDLGKGAGYLITGFISISAFVVMFVLASVIGTMIG